MSTQTKVTVIGAGGFIGHHLCKYLVTAIGCAAWTSKSLNTMELPQTNSNYSI